jgi:predicted nucleic acid-binding protein
MAKYLLDSDVITYIGNSESPFFKPCFERLNRLNHEDILCVSILTIYELDYSIAIANAELALDLEINKTEILENFAILPLSLEASEIYGRIKSSFKRRSQANTKTMKGHTVDLMVAATAIDQNAVVVSNDHIFSTIKEFEPDLIFDNWAKPSQ